MRTLIVAILAVTLPLCGCSTSAPRPQVSATPAAQPNLTVPDEPFYVLAERYGLSFVGGGDDTSVRLPDDISVGAQWGVVQSVIAGNGYDLKPYAGKTVRVFTQPLEQKWKGSAARFVAVVYEGKTIAAYVYVQDYIPGVFSLSEVGHPADSASE